jgi:hypothetical protein
VRNELFVIFSRRGIVFYWATSHKLNPFFVFYYIFHLNTTLPSLNFAKLFYMFQNMTKIFPPGKQTTCVAQTKIQSKMLSQTFISVFSIKAAFLKIIILFLDYNNAGRNVWYVMCVLFFKQMMESIITSA